MKPAPPTIRTELVPGRGMKGRSLTYQTLDDAAGQLSETSHKSVRPLGINRAASLDDLSWHHHHRSMIRVISWAAVGGFGGKAVESASINGSFAHIGSRQASASQNCAVLPAMASETTTSPIHLVERGHLEPGGWLSSLFNLSSATLGAGALAMPAVFRDTGVILGTVLMVVAAFATVFSVRLLTILSERIDGGFTYEALARHLVGPKFSKFVSLLIVSFMFVTSILYVSLIGDNVDVLLTQFPRFPLQGVTGRRIVTATFGLTLMLPMSLPREINALRFASMLGVVSILFVVVAVIVHALTSTPLAQVTRNLTWVSASYAAVQQLPTCVFAFICQPNTFVIYAELRPRTVSHMDHVTSLAMAMCALMYCGVGIAGFAEFGDSARSNILLNFSPWLSTWYVTAAFAAVTLTLTVAFPLCIMPTRDSILDMMQPMVTTLHPQDQDDEGEDPPVDLLEEEESDTQRTQRLFLSSSLAAAALIGGLVVPDVKVLYGLLGGGIGSTLAFVLPAFFALRARSSSVALLNNDSNSETRRLGHVALIWALLLLGLAIGGLGTWMAVSPLL